MRPFINIRKLRLLIWIVTCTLAAATGVVVWLSVALPVRQLTAPPASDSIAIASVTQAGASLSLVRDLQKLAQVNLRRLLHDPAPPKATPSPPVVPPPPLSFRLTGTICEPGHSEAMIQMSDGTNELKSVGDRIDNAKITDIQEGKMTVDYFGQSLYLNVGKSEGG